jgi:Ser/Thr protein kinase RdoA (MazF antagonist)
MQIPESLGKRYVPDHDDGRQKFLLRIHRLGYHPEAALHEELACLDQLSQDTLLREARLSRNRRLLSSFRPSIPEGRFCSLLEWIDGRFMNKAPTLSRVHELGGIIGRIHRNTKSIKVTHRRYWDAEGLVGKNPKFGSVEHIPKISEQDQQVSEPLPTPDIWPIAAVSKDVST